MAPSYTKTYQVTDSQLTVLLYNFDVGSAVLKPAHIQYLASNVPPLLLSNDVKAVVVGLASPSGPDAFNLTLSKSRADSVASFIKGLNPTNSLASLEIKLGEAAAQLAGLKDGSEDGRWRGVLLTIGSPPKPVGRYFERAWIYDASVDAFKQLITANDHPNTFMIPIQSINRRSANIVLTEWFDQLLANGTTFGSAIFITHGDSGVIRLDGDDLNARTLALYFTGQGYERLFQGRGRLYFAGCDCAADEAGWEFLAAAGRVFLRSAGGVSFGWTSLGFAIPSYLRPSSGHALHLWGHVRQVVFGPGGVELGRTEEPRGLSELFDAFSTVV